MLYLSPEGSIPFVKIITAYSLNCSLQNADMHGYELFMAMDENRDWKLNFFRQSMFQNRVHKTGCLSDLMIEHTTECSVILWFIHSSVQLFRRSAVQTFS